MRSKWHSDHTNIQIATKGWFRSRRSFGNQGRGNFNYIDQPWQKEQTWVLWLYQISNTQIRGPKHMIDDKHNSNFYFLLAQENLLWPVANAQHSLWLLANKQRRKTILLILQRMKILSTGSVVFSQINIWWWHRKVSRTVRAYNLYCSLIPIMHVLWGTSFKLWGGIPSLKRWMNARVIVIECPSYRDSTWTHWCVFIFVSDTGTCQSCVVTCRSGKTTRKVIICLLMSKDCSLVVNVICNYWYIY